MCIEFLYSEIIKIVVLDDRIEVFCFDVVMYRETIDILEANSCAVRGFCFAEFLSPEAVNVLVSIMPGPTSSLSSLRGVALDTNDACRHCRPQCRTCPYWSRE